MEYFDRIMWDIIQEGDESIPVFLLQTDNFDLTLEHMGPFPVSPMPVNLNLMRSLPFSTDTNFPENRSLRIELAFEDPFPQNAFEIDLAEEEVFQLETANNNSQKVRFILEGKNGKFGQKKSKELHTLHPWILDWSGVLGIHFHVRLAASISSNETLENLIQSLHQHLEEHGYATGIHTELGILYRMLGDYDRAKESCIHEIRRMTLNNGTPGNGVYIAVNNLAVIYKIQNEFSRANQLYRLALHYNPNHVESLLGIAGTLENMDLSLTCLARAYRIRPEEPALLTVLETINKISSRSVADLTAQVYELARLQDLSTPIQELVISDPFILLVDAF